MKIPFFITVLLFAYGLSYAQQTSLKGNIYDDETGEAIIYANVILDEGKSNTSSDLQGFFTFANIEPGMHILKVSYLGYETFEKQIEIKSGQSHFEKVLLKPEGFKLQSVDISAQKQQRKTETQISKIQISQKQLKALPSIGGEADIVQYLQVMPGIISTGDQGGQLYIRGALLSKIKLLLMDLLL